MHLNTLFNYQHEPGVSSISTKCSSSGTLSSSGSSKSPIAASKSGGLKAKNGRLRANAAPQIRTTDSPEVRVVFVLEGGTLGQQLGDTHRADFLLRRARYFLQVGDKQLLQHHSEHATKRRKRSADEDAKFRKTARDHTTSQTRNLNTLGPMR